MENKKLTYATIVATPTKSAWSQVYNAGSLFAVLSLKKPDTDEEEDILAKSGRAFLDTLEEEYFSLEIKNLAAIKDAVAKTDKRAAIDEKVTVSFVLASEIQKTLYVFIQGEGKVIIKRGEKVGTVLEGTGGEELLSASGFLQDGDCIVLETEQFAQIVPHSTLVAALDNATPSDIAESLSPQIHEKEEGTAAALILAYKEENVEKTQDQEIEDVRQTRERFKIHIPFHLNIAALKNLTHRRKVFLTIAGILVFILFLSVFFAAKKQEDAKTKALFQNIYTLAQRKYDEGQNLADLNKNLAREDLTEAKKILTESRSKFRENGNEEKQIGELLKKVDDALSFVSGTTSVNPSQVDPKNSMLLTLAMRNSDAAFFSQDSKNVYFVNQNEIVAVEKAAEKKKTIIKNAGYWTDPGGLGLYFGNVYVVDRKSGQILKFVPIEDNFTKTNYLSNTQDFSKAQSLAIDSSIYVLLQDGTLKKFTRGKPEDFKIKDLPNSFGRTSRIFTHPDTNNIYILDVGRGSIVVLSKNGTFQTQYQASVLKAAKDFEVVEKDKKIFVLSQNKVWQIDIK